MKLFNIIKPDMLNDEASLRFYLERMKKDFGIEIRDMYYLGDWTRIAKLIYELDLQMTQTDPAKILERRKQLLVSILGYDTYFRNQGAVVTLYDAPENRENILQELKAFKKELRELFVNNTDKYYIRILNEPEIDYSQPLEKMDLSKIKTEVIVVPPHVELPDPNLKMAFFNHMHFPECDPEAINRELNLLKDEGILEEKNQISR